jgi:hypothetical protein
MDVLEGDVIETHDIESLARRIDMFVFGSQIGYDYSQKIASDLASLGDNLELVSDANCWDDPIEGFHLVGTRYIDEDN